VVWDGTFGEGGTRLRDWGRGGGKRGPGEEGTFRGGGGAVGNDHEVAEGLELEGLNVAGPGTEMVLWAGAAGNDEVGGGVVGRACGGVCCGHFV
jgi:hypothetical protein